MKNEASAEVSYICRERLLLNLICIELYEENDPICNSSSDFSKCFAEEFVVSFKVFFFLKYQRMRHSPKS